MCQFVGFMQVCIKQWYNVTSFDKLSSLFTFGFGNMTKVKNKQTNT